MPFFRTGSTTDRAMKARSARRLAPLWAVLLLGACASAPPEVDVTAPFAGTGRTTPSSGPSSLPVAVNLVSTLVQLDGYSPYDTTVQTNPPKTEFGERLIEALQIAGYGIQVVSADQGRNYLAYRTLRTETEAGQRVVFEMQLGFVSLSREMALQDERYVPASPVTVRGAAPGPVALNGSVFVAVPGRPLGYPSGVRFLDEGGEVLSEALYRYTYYPTGEARGDVDAVALEPSRFLRQATGRLYERGTGPEALGLRPAADFVPLKSLTLRFPTLSDELLGQGNRNAIEALSRYFQPATDRLTVLSCTPGRERSDATVARSARIKSELLTLGIPGAQVLEPGCPDDTPRSVARQGIRLTLERLTPS